MEPFRFSRRPNRAHEIAWRGWSAEAFAAAESGERPILLHLTAVWCLACQEMDETTFSDPEVIALINEHFVAIRVDTDRAPHVQDRYMTAGWPTTAFLTPTGEVLWAGGSVDAEEMRGVGTGVLTAWHDRRAEFEAEIERRRRALDAARNRPTSHGLVRREAADDVLTAILESADARHGGFGGAPKFPAPSAIELLYRHGSADPAQLAAADHALDGMIAGELLDREEGGFFRYALAEDWTTPRREKLLAVNADLLRIYALGARARGRSDWADAARGVVEWVDRTLATEDGLWAACLLAGGVDGVDATVHTGWNAAWIGALAEAAADLGDEAWAGRAAAGLDTLLDAMAADGGLLHHYREPGGEPTLPLLAMDLLAAGRACVAVAQVTGDSGWLHRAESLAHTLDHRFWAEDGGFHDRLRSDDDVGALRYRDRPFELNSLAARFLLDLAHATGERKYRALAERVLAALSPQAGRYGVAGADFAIAVEDFFQAPLRVFIVGEPEVAAPLRAAACALALPDRRVWPAANGARVGPLDLRTGADAAAFVCGERGASAPVTEPERLEDAVAAVT